MRFLCLLTDGPGARGGIAEFNSAFLNALNASPHIKSTQAITRFGDRAPSTQVHAHRMPWCLAALRQAARVRPDIVFCGHLYSLPVARAIARLFRSRLWLQLHGIESWHAPNWESLFAGPDLDLATSVSRFTRERFLRWSAMPPEKVRILANTFTPVSESLPCSGSFLPSFVLNGRQVVMTVSRLDRRETYKGHRKVLNAVTALKQRFPSLLYLIVGDGDGRTDLEDTVRDLGLDHYVHFTGHVSRDTLQALYNRADLFVLPSSDEGFGIVYLEALAAGTPVIAGDIGGSVDALADGVLGTLIDPGSQQELEDAIARHLDGHVARASPLIAQRFAFHHFSAHVDRLVQSLSTATPQPCHHPP